MINSISKAKKRALKIAFVFNKGRLSRLTAAKRGDAPKEFFFGALELEQKGHQVGYFEVDAGWAPGRLSQWTNFLLNKRFMPEKTYGSILAQVWKLIEQLKTFDCIIGTTSGIAFALGIWRQLYLLRVPIMAIHCGLVNNPYNAVRRKLTIAILHSMHTMLYGKGELNPLIDIFPGINEKLTVNQFGVDTNFWQPISGQHDEKYILSVGNDGRRDYDLFIRVAAKLQQKVIIVTKIELPASLPQNVEVIRGSWHEEVLSDEELRSLYQKALCVVVPLKPSYQPSGQSVCLQAMACGRPVILTDTKGLWDRRTLKHGENVLLIQPNNINDMKDAVETLMEDNGFRTRLGNASREYVLRDATIEQYSDRIESLCMSVTQSTSYS